MSMGSTAIPGGSAISSRGQTSFFAMAVLKYFAFDRGCKWPKQRHFIDADIRPHFIFCVYNSLYFGVQKAKNGDRGTIVFTATLNACATPKNQAEKKKEKKAEWVLPCLGSIDLCRAITCYTITLPLLLYRLKSYNYLLRDWV